MIFVRRFMALALGMALAAGVFGGPARGEPVQLSEVAVNALKHLPALRKSRAAAETAGYEADKAAANAFGPTAAVTASGGAQNTAQQPSLSNKSYQLFGRAQLGVSLNLPIFTPGAGEAVRSAESSVEGACHLLNEAIQSTLLEITTQYVKVLELRANLQAFRDIEPELRKALDAIKTQVGQHSLPQSDLDDAQARFAAKMLLKDQTEKELRQRELVLSVFAGRAVATLDLLAPGVPDLPVQLGSGADQRIVNLALERSPSYQKAAVDVKIAQAENERDRQAQWGSAALSLGGAVGKNVDGNRGANNSLSAVVSWTIPLDLSGAAGAEMRAATSRIGEALAEQDRVKDQVSSDLLGHVVEFNKAQTRREQAQSQFDSRIKVVSQIERGVASGIATQPEYSQALDQILSARLEFNSATFGQVLVAHQVAKDLGLLPSALGVVPSVHEVRTLAARDRNFWYGVLGWTGGALVSPTNCSKIGEKQDAQPAEGVGPVDTSSPPAPTSVRVPDVKVAPVATPADTVVATDAKPGDSVLVQDLPTPEPKMRAVLDNRPLTPPPADAPLPKPAGNADSTTGLPLPSAAPPAAAKPIVVDNGLPPYLKR